MRLILHIFRKDSRRLLPPLLALIAIEATAAYSEIHKYSSDLSASSRDLAEPSLFLLPFAWIFLIAAVVLQERLPGTRQYWLTRPIGWHRLLAAKLLFVAVFVNAVWFLSDCVILLALHLPVQPLILLLRQIPLTALLFLPAFSLAGICSGLGQIAMGLIIAAFAFVFDLLIPTLFRSHNAPYSIGFVIDSGRFTRWAMAGLAAATALIILLQFARRATLAARLLFLIPLFGFIPITFFATISGGFPERPVFTDTAPTSHEKVPAVSFDFESGRRPAPVSTEGFKGLQFPIRIQNLPPGVYIEGETAADLPTTGNQASGFLHFDQTGRWIRLALPKELPAGPIPVKVNVAFSLFRVEKTETIAVFPHKIFSPASGVFCRDDLAIVSLFTCWSGPLQPRNIEYRAFLEIDRNSVELVDTEPGPFSQSKYLPWTFSPLDSWALKPLRGDPANLLREAKNEMPARFLTLSRLGNDGQYLQAENVDLNKYIVKP